MFCYLRPRETEVKCLCGTLHLGYFYGTLSHSHPVIMAYCLCTILHLGHFYGTLPHRLSIISGTKYFRGLACRMKIFSRERVCGIFCGCLSAQVVRDFRASRSIQRLTLSAF